MSGRRRARGRVRGLIDSPRALAMIAVCGVCVMVALMIVIAVSGHSAHRSRPEALTVRAAPSAPVPVEAPEQYLRRADRADAGHVTVVRFTGTYLRVYTDLPESATDSPAAIALCESAARYLEAHDRDPVVFVQGADYAVLANKAGPADDCRLKPVP